MGWEINVWHRREWDEIKWRMSKLTVWKVKPFYVPSNVVCIETTQREDISLNVIGIDNCTYRFGFFPVLRKWNVFNILYLPACMDGRISLSPLAVILVNETCLVKKIVIHQRWSWLIWIIFATVAILRSWYFNRKLFVAESNARKNWNEIAETVKY